MKKLLLILGAVVFLGAPLHAATLAITEGTRDTVDGTFKIGGPDSPNSGDGYDLGTVGFGGGEFTQIDIHGRIVGAADFYNFSANSSFIIEFIFDDVFVNLAEIESGFIREAGGNNTSDFSLNLDGISTTGSPLSYSTNVTSIADNGGTSLIFSGSADTLYVFGVDNTSPSAAATYDIRISAVPLPAGVVLLLTGLGALGIVRRRRS